MNNREIFEVAEIEVIAFDAEDIIKTSNITDGGHAAFYGEEDPIDYRGYFVAPSK